VAKKEILWTVNVTSFLLLVAVSVTGLVNWLLLPHGPGPSAGFVRTLRHLLREFHAWGAVAFCFICALHIWLHWGYIRRNLNRSGRAK
jgi:hypothetical protein